MTIITNDIMDSCQPGGSIIGPIDNNIPRQGYKLLREYGFRPWRTHQPLVGNPLIIRDQNPMKLKNPRKKLASVPFSMETYAEAKDDLNLGWSSLEESIRAAPRGYKLVKIYAIPNIILVGAIMTGLIFIGVNYANANFLNLIPIPV